MNNNDVIIFTGDSFTWGEGLELYTDTPKWINERTKLNVWSELYQKQDYDFPQIIKDRKQYLCLSPLLDGKNITQINKNIRALNLKNDPKRKGPAVSATFYKTGDIKLGNNGMFWTISKGKWAEIKEKPKRIKIKLNNDTTPINKIPFIGQHNTKPIFLLSFKNTKPREIISGDFFNLQVVVFILAIMTNIPS